MANLCNTINNNCSSSSSPQREPDEISLFLQQILLRSASSSSTFTPHQSFLMAESEEPVVVPVTGRISASQLSSVLNSSSVGELDIEQNECDCESEEAVEALAEETEQKAKRHRSSSKRSRAADVHNLSEKRRRSRINEKMKALQNLIPNSNKTDKVSMLDEAIEYLKQLQLQVQMLTMRNGLSFYPMCPPGMMPYNQISQIRPDLSNREGPSNANMAKETTLNHNISADTLLSLQDNCVKHEPVADFSTIKSSLELESSIQDHLEPFQFSTSSKVKMLACQPLNEDYAQASLTGKDDCLGAKATISSSPFASFSTSSKNSLDVCVPEGSQ